jgi:DNA polymerase-3 subunit delta
VWLLRGDDESLVASTLIDKVRELVGNGDRALMVDEFDGEDYDLATVADAASTMPFLTDSRVVVAREIGRFSSDEMAPLIAYLADPMPTTSLVLTASSGRMPKAFLDAFKACGGQSIDTNPPTKARDRQQWFDEQISASGLKLEPAARAMVAERLGEDAGRLAILLETLIASFGAGARLGVDEVEPFCGEGGAVPPWELTDAIDRGDTVGALTRLHRMLHGGERHPLQLMSTLHSHYARMLKLDGSDARDEASAAAVLGIKGSTFPARKALDQSRKLGSPGVQRAIGLLADADLDLRGAKDWPDELVMEVLVARLTKLAPSPRRR